MGFGQAYAEDVRFQVVGGGKLLINFLCKVEYFRFIERQRKRDYLLHHTNSKLGIEKDELCHHRT